ncbi:cell division cycle protein 20 homolog [Patella vulgata]|uniref:cell division cycle protein 20 homolog n=1 Tax=Patella vulgata TaxID=6465 RepID=UPI00217FFDC1|nr:cell division cycle protein 20 homolog [Patella vulgata]XP_050400762.1 cell division cycle protein 20 homolog [Patella vulgata]
MAQFTLENELNSVLRMDAPLTRAAPMGYQRKALNDSECNASLNISLKTPKKNANKSFSGSKTPSSSASGSSKKTPKSGGKLGTPGNRTRTPGGDRFIPNRSTSQFNLGHYKHMMEQKGPDESEALLSPSEKEYKRVMNENLNGDLMSSKILSFKAKAPSAPESFNSNLRVLYSSSKTASTSKKAMRQVPQVPERILDAPDIMDDYYLNLLDWSVTNNLAVCLGGAVYLWNGTTGTITQLMGMDNDDEYIGAVSWVKEGNYLAVGTSTGEVQLWDVVEQKRLRNMAGHSARVSSLSWNSFILSSGSRSGNIHHHDVRVPQHHVATLAGHSQEVCGLRWSPDGKFLASGGNDNILNIWSAQFNNLPEDNQPLHVFSQHQAAVKALSWCPWQPGILASGGGTADRQICFWNCNTGTHLSSVDAKSQVCSLLWSKEHKELISSHGFAQNQLTIWKYPSMTKVADLTGHTARVLHMAMSPDGTTVVSAGADETLRLWKCFEVDDQKKKVQKSVNKDSSTSFRRAMIR